MTKTRLRIAEAFDRLLGLPKRQVIVEESIRYHDMTRGVVWDVSDYEFITKKYARIRKLDEKGNIAEKRRAIDDLEDRISRSINDQTAFDYDSGRYYEPIQHTIKDDLVTNAGRERLAELTTRETNRTFDYMAIGLSQREPEDDDNALFTEVTRESSRLTGYVSAGGAVIKHSCIFDPNTDSNTYWEVAPVDKATVTDEDQFILARVVFEDTFPLVHVFEQDFFSITHFIYTTSSR